MLEQEYTNYSNWDVRQLDAKAFLKAIPLCMLLALPVGIWLSNNIILWLVIGALVGVVVGCESTLEQRLINKKEDINYLNQNTIHPPQGGANA